MKHNKIFLVALLIIFICSATAVLAEEKGNFPSDPRAGSLQPNIKPSSSFNSNPETNNFQTAQELEPGVSGANQNNINYADSLTSNGFFTFLMFGILGLAVVFFLALIFFVLRNMHLKK